MTDIAVKCNPNRGGWSCKVRLSDDTSATDHVVRVGAAELGRLAPGATDPTDLVTRSFAFLLRREAKESILRSFDLPVIRRYFPDYERTITAR